MKFVTNKIHKWLLLASLCGLLLFSAVFAITFIDKQAVEAAAKSAVAEKVKEKIQGRFNLNAEPSEKANGMRAKLMNKLKDDYLNKIDLYQKFLEEDLPKLIAEHLADYSATQMTPEQRAEAKKIYEQFSKSALQQGIKDKMAKLKTAKDNMSDVIRGDYVFIVEKLFKDIRIFSGTNIFMFALLLMALIFKKSKSIVAYVPASLLLVSTVISIAIYIFGQNWFYTILLNDYMGYGYVAYAALVTGFLFDIFLNKARVCHFISNAVGSLFSLFPA